MSITSKRTTSLSFLGFNFSGDIYAVAAIILLPINSAFNPLLYSDLPEFIWKNTFGRAKLCIREENYKSNRNHNTRPIHLNKNRAPLAGKNEILKLYTVVDTCNRQVRINDTLFLEAISDI